VLSHRRLQGVEVRALVVGELAPQGALDAAAAKGVPAHVTVLHPFVDPSEVDDQLIATVAGAMAAVHAFDCSSSRSRWFGQDVLWLDPDPAQPFRDLTTAVWSAFPEHPPYGGAHDDVVPHLTVAERRLADLPAVRAAEGAVHAGLPITTRIDQPAG
jgi:2'-5' RNA ligase